MKKTITGEAIACLSPYGSVTLDDIRADANRCRLHGGQPSDMKFGICIDRTALLTAYGSEDDRIAGIAISNEAWFLRNASQWERA